MSEGLPVGRSTPIAPPDPPLTDGVLRLRQRRVGDLNVLAAASRDPLTLRWLDDPVMDAEARRTSVARAAEQWRSGRAAPQIIAEATTDHAVGMINLQFRSDDVATVAYSVFPAFRGRGFAPRAVLLVTGWALRDLGVVELYLEADEANEASVRVAEKCRFDRFGTRAAEGPDGASRTVAVFRRSNDPAPGDQRQDDQGSDSPLIGM